jgi:RecA-family ATPase
VTDEELSGEVQVKNIMDWFDRLRQHYGVFVWLLHHHRKAQGQNKKPNKISDVYGSQYITARATSVLALWETSNANAIAAIPLKLRLSKKPDPFFVFRDDKLNFNLQKNVTVLEQTVTEDLTDEEESDTVDEQLAGVADFDHFHKNKEGK